MATKGMTYSTSRKTVQSELKATGKNASAKNVTAEIKRRQSVNRARAIKSQATAQAKKQAKIEAKKQVLANVELAIWQNPTAIEDIAAIAKSKDALLLRSEISKQIDENIATNTAGIKKDIVSAVKDVAQYLTKQIHYNEFLNIDEYFAKDRPNSKDVGFRVFYEVYSSGGRRYASAEEILTGLIQNGLSTEAFRNTLIDRPKETYAEFMKKMMSSK